MSKVDHEKLYLLLQRFFVAAGDLRWAEAEQLQLEVDFDPETKMAEAAHSLDEIETEIMQLLNCPARTKPWTELISDADDED